MTQETDKNGSEFDLKAENVADAMRELGRRRENPAEEQSARQLARQIFRFADTIGRYDIAGDALLNDHLVLQHQVMQTKSDDPLYQQKMEDMRQMADQAFVYITEHQVDDLLFNAHRALGRSAEYAGNFDMALQHYQKARQTFRPKTDNLVYNARPIEVEGFEAIVKIKKGEVDEGLKDAETVIKKFHQPADGQTQSSGQALYAVDPYTAKVWESGIYLHMAQALAAIDAKQYKPQIDNVLILGKQVLMATEEEKAKMHHGDPKFTIRNQEFRDLTSQLAL